MSLLDALLLDPYRLNVWIAFRTDGVPGSGTQSDPYDGSTQAKFDALMNGLGTYTCVHLGPGIFKTAGYNDLNPTAGWQLKAGMKIVGSGIDVTFLQLAGSNISGNYYAVGHQLSVGGSPNFADFAEVCELTVDCNLSGYGTLSACGAVRVMGNHSRVRRIKAKNWGAKGSPCLVVAVITAHIGTGAWWVEDCGIEDCIAVSPDSGNVGPVRIFHAGGWEGDTSSNPTAFGVAPFIRNCFADAGQTYPFTVPIGALSMNWCKAGIIEGNQAHNVIYGFYQDDKAGQDIVIRNNWFKNVYKGVYLGSGYVFWGASGSLSFSSPVATVTMSNASLQPGDIVSLGSSGTIWEGLDVTVLANPAPTTSSFAFNSSLFPQPLLSWWITALLKVIGIRNVVIEGNTIELATVTTGEVIGIQGTDQWGTANPAQDPIFPTYVYGTVIIRDNKIRYVDGLNDPSYVGYAMQFNAAADLQVRNNVIDSASSIAYTIQNTRCGAATYFNNLTPAGKLIQGRNDDNKTSYEELATNSDFALVMGLFNKRN